MHADLLQALKRLDRKDSVPVHDFRMIFRGFGEMPDRGDPICEALVSHGWATRSGDALTLSENGRRALETNR